LTTGQILLLFAAIAVLAVVLGVVTAFIVAR
jgi:hypothetical protein